jgi:hypothetical protein
LPDFLINFLVSPVTGMFDADSTPSSKAWFNCNYHSQIFQRNSTEASRRVGASESKILDRAGLRNRVSSDNLVRRRKLSQKPGFSDGLPIARDSETGFFKLSLTD